MKSRLVRPLVAVALAASAGALSAQASGSERYAAAADLPRLATELRGAGLSASELAKVFGVFRDQRVPPTDAKVVLEEEWKASREHGPVPGLGDFVQARLAEGLRGQALAAAIRSEHQRRGTGGDGMGGKATERKGVVAPDRKDSPAQSKGARPDQGVRPEEGARPEPGAARDKGRAPR